MIQRSAIVLALLVVVPWSGPARAAAPSGKLVMLDVDKLNNVTSKHDPDGTHLSWREIVNTGINGVHFRWWTQSGDSNAYTQSEWVAEAHEYGLWVCGGTGSNNPVVDMIAHAQDLASMGVDFIQLDEPMGFGLTEGDYNSIKSAVYAVNPDCPVVITDVFYNDTIATWPTVDGLIGEVYIDDWYVNIDHAAAYQNAHPNQEVMMWVWLPVRLVYPEEPCTSLPDSRFDLWFGDSFDRIGQTLLFIFQARDPLGDACSWATNWSSRAATISATTAGHRVDMPQWKDFIATGPGDGTPDCTVQVSSAGAGLDPESVEAHYSVDGGETWSEWSDVDCTGSHGSTGWETITARNVPFGQVSSTLNKVRLKITDTYSGQYYRSARTDKMIYDVIIEQIDEPDAGQPTDDAGQPTDDAGHQPTDDAGQPPEDGSAITVGCGCRTSSAKPGGWPGVQLLFWILLVMAAWRR